MIENNNPKKETSPVMRIVKNFSPAIINSLRQINLISPEFSLISQSILSIIGYFGDYANDKTSDLLTTFINNKEKIILEIVNSDKFKASFVDIISKNITEGNEEKRQLLKNYIINFASGADSDFNEHTRLLGVLNSITIEEISVLMIWDENGLMSKNTQYKNIGRITAGEIKQLALSDRKIENGVNVWSPYAKSIYELSEQKDRINQILLSLGYKGLLYVLSEDNFGSGEEVRVKNITEFGASFLNFIRQVE